MELIGLRSVRDRVAIGSTNDIEVFNIEAKKKMTTDYDEWEKQRRALTPLFNQAILLMLSKGIKILESDKASFKTSDATRLISTAKELQESLRPLSESERAVEMLGIAGSAIRNGLLPEESIEVLHDRLAQLKADLSRFERGAISLNQEFQGCYEDGNDMEDKEF